MMKHGYVSGHGMTSTSYSKDAIVACIALQKRTVEFSLYKRHAVCFGQFIVILTADLFRISIFLKT